MKPPLTLKDFDILFYFLFNLNQTWLGTKGVEPLTSIL